MTFEETISDNFPDDTVLPLAEYDEIELDNGWLLDLYYEPIEIHGGAMGGNPEEHSYKVEYIFKIRRALIKRSPTWSYMNLLPREFEFLIKVIENRCHIQETKVIEI